MTARVVHTLQAQKSSKDKRVEKLSHPYGNLLGVLEFGTSPTAKNQQLSQNATKVNGIHGSSSDSNDIPLESLPVETQDSSLTTAESHGPYPHSQKTKDDPNHPDTQDGTSAEIVDS